MGKTKELRTLDDVRARLSGLGGREWWRTLEELCDAAPVREFLRAEFPSQELRFGDPVGRRGFLQLMGASLALGGLGACTRQPDERILPWADAPESRVPGVPQRFATAVPRPHGALGLLATSYEGRPIKLDGNPDHPASLGASDGMAQAELLSLYDPDRSRVVLRAGQIATWSDFLGELRTALEGLGPDGAGLRVLGTGTTSPTLAGLRQSLSERFPAARWHAWESLHRDAERAGAELAFGRDVAVRLDLAAADVVLALDADPLFEGPYAVRHARDLAGRRRGRRDAEGFARLYSVESSSTVTGAWADHRLALRPARIETFARALGAALGVEGTGRPELAEREQRFLDALVADLRARGAGACIAVGPWCSPATHAIAHAANHALGAVGRTVHLHEPVTDSGRSVEDLRALVAAMRAGEVRALVIVGGNPVYDAPADLDFAGALEHVRFRVHHALHEDETSLRCLWHLPATHFLESWGDVRDHHGVATIVQPLIAPLWQGRSALEVIAALVDRTGTSAYDLVREHWRAALGAGEDFETFWRHALHDGVVAGSAAAALELAPRASLELGAPPAAPGGFDVSLRPDASVLDGRHANNGWLQELPRPLSRLTWGNAALVSPATAARLGVENEDVLAIEADGRRVEVPAWVQPGHPDDALTLHLGYGRAAVGTVGDGVGVDVGPLRTSAALWTVLGARVERTGRTAALVSVQDHARMEGRELVRVREFDRFRIGSAAGPGTGPHGAAAPDAGEHGAAPGETADAHPTARLGGAVDLGGHGDVGLYPPREGGDYAWGMVIDLNACIGCNACMVACQAENNVPVVGAEQVAVGREMHWLRIDRYYEGELDAPKVLHQPVPCMHCELAPCEVVCPVAATVHSPEGLNEMVYNRCVGTRYCANNCPYKVRRFNFFHYADYETEVLKLGRNPRVTVRSRGVMEKCTYCVQRINAGRIEAKKEGRSIRDGEVVTACQSACPTRAIAFGDLADPDSAVTALRSEPHHYALLEELGTKPRTTYLAKLESPNPELEAR